MPDDPSTSPHWLRDYGDQLIGSVFVLRETRSEWTQWASYRCAVLLDRTGAWAAQGFTSWLACITTELRVSRSTAYRYRRNGLAWEAGWNAERLPGLEHLGPWDEKLWI